MFLMNLLLFSKYLLVKIISASLAASEGCIPNGPIPNQERAPFRTLPIPGMSTKISKMMAIPKIIFDFSLYQ